MAKKFANILGLSNVFGYNSETNTYLPYLLLDSVKNDINYNTICFVEADENDEGFNIKGYDIKSGDTFIITQKGVFAVVPKDGFKSNSGDLSDYALRQIYINGDDIADTQFEYTENDEIKNYTPGNNYKLNLEDSEYLTISSLCKDHNENIISCKYELDKEKLDALYKITTPNTNDNISIFDGENGKEISVNGYSWNSELYSFSEGDNTYALGTESHAEGEETYAKGECSHAEGYGTLANGSNSHAEGAGYMESTITQEIVIKEFVNANYLNNVYEYTGVDFNYFTDFNDILLNGGEIYDPQDTNLVDAVAEIVASKYIEGYGDDMPTGMYLKIRFYNNYTFDVFPEPEGGDGKLALVLLRSGSYGNASHTEGDLTIALGNASHAEGLYSCADGYYSHAEGENSVASGNISHTEGYYNISNGNYSHSEGYFNTSGGDASHTEGSTNIAIGEASHAEGIENKSLGGYSHTEGYNNQAKSSGAHAEGGYTLAHGDGSHSEGRYTLAYGEASHAEGGCTKAYGTSSHAEGYFTEANGDASHAEGDHTVTNSPGEHAEGRYNLSNCIDSREEVPEYTTISSIGIGSDNDTRSNAVEVMLNGDVYIKGIGGYDGTNVFEASHVQKVISDMNSLITSLKAVLVEKGIINEEPIANAPEMEIPEVEEIPELEEPELEIPELEGREQ